MINWPSHIQVLHVKYEVILKPRTEMDDDDGFCCDDRLLICVCSALPMQNQIETLWHEIKHAINTQMDLSDDSTEEDFVLRGTKGELAVFRSNPCLLEMFRLL